MSTRVAYRDGGKTSEEGLLRFASNSYSKSGVLDDNALLVVQNGTPNNTVVVSAGDVIIGTTEPTTGVSNYFYHGWVNSDTEIVTITNNISGNPRIDSIIAYINKSVVDSTNNDNPGVLTCVAVAGTPAASPVQPTDATIQAAVGVGNPWIILAQVAVANGFSTITTANITDARPKAATVPHFIDNFEDFVASGSIPNTSASLTTTLPKLEAFIGGLQVSKPALAHLFTASKDTYVDISTSVKPTGTDDYTYTEVTVGATAPSIAAGSIRLYKITSGAATITAVSDLRNTGMVGGSQLSTDAKSGWTTQTTLPTSVVYNGNRSYTATYPSSVASFKSPGQRNRITRTVTAPTQSTSLNGTNQYWVKTSPNKLAFTDDFVVDAYVKLTSYAQGSIVGRVDSTPANGWYFEVLATGQLRLIAYNAGGSNYSAVVSYQSIPLNKWVRVTAQLDMSTFTATTTTSYIMIDGVDVPCSVSRAGTNPTTLVQAGDLAVGRPGSFVGHYFPGKIAQVAIFNTKVTQSQMRTYHSQGYTGTETSLASAYSLNGVATDLNTTTPNDLIAMNSAGYATDSPFTTQGNDIPNGTTDYAITMSVSSDGLTEVLQVPEGCAIPTSGGISAISYSGLKAPYGLPAQRSRWVVTSEYRTAQTSTFAAGTAQAASCQITIPIGAWNTGYQGSAVFTSTNTAGNATISMSASTSVIDDSSMNLYWQCQVVNIGFWASTYRTKAITLASAIPYYLVRTGHANLTSMSVDAGTQLFADNAYL